PYGHPATFRRPPLPAKSRTSGRPSPPTALESRPTVGAVGAGSLVLGEESYRRAERAARLYVNSQEEVNETIDRLRETAVRGFQPLDEITRRYQRLGVIQEQLGATDDQTFAILQAAADAERLQGGRTASTSAGVNQLIQGLTSGRLGGDELRSLRENLPRLANAIAEGLSELRGEQIGIGDLRGLSERGLLTSTDAANALLTSAGSLRGQAGGLDPLLSEEFQNLRTQFGLLNQDLGRLGGSGGLLGEVLRGVADFVEFVRESIPGSQERRIQADPGVVESVSAFGSGIRAALLSPALDAKRAFDEAFDDSVVRQRTDQLADIRFAEAQAANVRFGLIENGAGSGPFQFEGLPVGSERFAQFLNSFQRSTESLERITLTRDIGGREFAETEARRESLLNQARRANGGVLPNSQSPLAERIDQLVDERLAAERAERTSSFAVSLTERNDELGEYLQIQRDSIGASREQQSADRERYRLEAEGRRLNISLAKNQISVAEELARADERTREADQLAQNFGRAGADFTRDLLVGLESVEDATGRLITRFSELILETLVFNQIQNGLSNFFGGEGGFASFLVGGVTPNATGNAFSPRGIEPFAMGGVVDTPTMFGFGRGRFGVMGEAGPEAVMPLERDGSGKLGVRASGGGSGSEEVLLGVGIPSSEFAKMASSADVKDAIARSLLSDQPFQQGIKAIASRRR
ncbi:MAG: tape measure protein, partial [Planctomycetota bacterium]